jgi:hypothetical protein
MPILFGRHSAQLFGPALMIERMVLAEPVVPTETSLLCDSIFRSCNGAIRLSETISLTVVH